MRKPWIQESGAGSVAYRCVCWRCLAVSLMAAAGMIETRQRWI